MEVKVLVVIVDVEAQEPPSSGGSSQDREPGARRESISTESGQEQTRRTTGLIASSSPKMPGSRPGNA